MGLILVLSANPAVAEEVAPVEVTAPAPMELALPGPRPDRVTGEELQRGGVDRLEDALHTVPGATADTAHGGLGTAIRRRGFQVTRTRYGRLPDIQRVFVRDPATVADVHLEAGPSALLDGVTAPGGVIRYEPVQPRFQSHSEARLVAGSHRYRRLVADHTAPVAEQWAYRATLAARDGSTDIGGFTNRRVHARLASTWRSGSGSHLTLAHEYQENHQPFLFGTVMAGDDEKDIQYGRVYADPRQSGRRRYQRTSVEWSSELGEGVTVLADAARAHVERDETIAGFWKFEDSSRSTLIGYYNDYRDRAQQTDLRLALRLEGAPRRHKWNLASL